MGTRHIFLLSLLLACKAEESEPKPTDGDTGSTADDTGDDTGSPPETNPCETLGLPVRDFQLAADDDSLYATAADFSVPLTDGSTWTLSEAWTGCDTYLIIQDTPRNASGWPYDLWDRDVDDLLDRLPRNAHIFFISDLGTTEDRLISLGGLGEQVDAALSAMDGPTADWWADRVHFISERSINVDGWLRDAMLSPRWPIAIDRFQRIRYVGSFADYNRYSSSAGWFEPNLAMAANEVVYYNFEAERQDRLDAVDATIVNIWTGTSASDPGWAGRRTTIDVELPDAATMSGFDTLEYDLFLGCVGEGEYGTCPAWDYLVYLYLCDMETEDNAHTDEACQPYVAGDPGVVEALGSCESADTGAAEADSGLADTGSPEGCSTDEDCGSSEVCVGYIASAAEIPEIPADTLSCDCRQPDGEIYDSTQSCNSEGIGYSDCSCSCGDEVGRWITTYHREGRWVHDASPLLPKLAAGGTQRFSFYTQQNYEIFLDLRLSDAGKDLAPAETLSLFTGGGFNEGYNDRDPITLSIPSDAAKVELAYVISGHGQVDPGNCAEFCVTSHHFYVNGEENEVQLSDAGSAQGCMDQVAEGTVPNQYGTWWYGRSNWCPGREVQVKTIDITSQVAPGEDNEFVYEGYYAGAAYTAGGASIRLNSWVTIHR
jgi:hypothetical protein